MVKKKIQIKLSILTIKNLRWGFSLVKFQTWNITEKALHYKFSAVFYNSSTEHLWMATSNMHLICHAKRNTETQTFTLNVIYPTTATCPSNSRLLISCEESLSITPGNIRKRGYFWYFKGYMFTRFQANFLHLSPLNETMAWNALTRSWQSSLQINGLVSIWYGPPSRKS